VLLVASLAFYAWGEAPYVVLVLGSVVFNYLVGSAIARSGDARSRKLWLAFGVAGNLLVLAIFKYSNFAVANINTLAPILAITPIALASIPLPLGSRSSPSTPSRTSSTSTKATRTPSATCLASRSTSCCSRSSSRADHPLARHRRPAAGARAAHRRRRVRRAPLRARPRQEGADRQHARRGRGPHLRVAAGELTTPLAWLGLVCYTLQIYFDFSGYSDMAIGLMRMFGFRILENFNYPYIARSIREFWRRWHISLSNWFRDYLYIPLGGNQRGERRAYANLVIVFLLCGLWHGASWPFVLWGIWHGLFLVVERAGLDRVLRRIGPLSHAYALLAVMGGWVLFRCETLTQAVAYYAAPVRARAGRPRAASAPRVPRSVRRVHVDRGHRVRDAARARDRPVARTATRMWQCSGSTSRGSWSCSCSRPRSWRQAPTILSSTSGSDRHGA
jgi:alginate O-acetyltransferase complex protein AlgI